MSKKTKYILGLVGTVSAIAIFLFVHWLIAGPHSIPGQTVVIHYESSWAGPTVEPFTQALTYEEAAQVRRALAPHWYRGGIGGCPFDERVSITVGNEVYYLAQDGCYCLKNAKSERYCEISKEDWAVLEEIFEKYGGKL